MQRAYGIEESLTDGRAQHTSGVGIEVGPFSVFFIGGQRGCGLWAVDEPGRSAWGWNQSEFDRHGIRGLPVKTREQRVRSQDGCFYDGYVDVAVTRCSDDFFIVCHM